MTDDKQRVLPRQWLCAWAAEQLQLAADAPAETLRARFCKDLQEEGFLPAPAMHDAAHALATADSGEPREPSWSPWTMRDYHNHLRTEVEHFAAEFFALPCPGRKQRWQELLSQSEGAPNLIGRLSFLALGLNVPTEISPTLSPRAAELAQRVKVMFVLRPAERAYARQELQADAREDQAAWEAAAKELKKRNAPLAELEPYLVDRLITWRTRAQEQRKIEKTAAAERRQLERAVANSKTSVFSGGGYGVLIAVAIISAVIRLGSSDSGPSNRPLPYRQFSEPLQLGHDEEKVRNGLEVFRALNNKRREEMLEAGIELPPDYEGDAMEILKGRGEEVRLRNEKWQAYRDAKREREAAERQRESYTGGSLPTNIPDSPTVP